MRNREYAGLIIVILTVIFAATFVAADPDGSTLSPGISERGTALTASGINASGGNVTLVDIDQTRVTDIWQGFYGDVTGEIILTNAAGNRFYDWTPATISGEVYATRTAITDWSTPSCGDSTDWEAEETALSIDSTATDGVNETYSSTAHPSFDIGTATLTSCPSTQPYNGSEVASQFWNVYVDVQANSVYVGLLANDDTNYLNGTSDFELMVPANRSATVTEYLFYVELN